MEGSVIIGIFILALLCAAVFLWRLGRVLRPAAKPGLARLSDLLVMFAMAAIVLGCIVAILAPVGHSKESAKRTACLSNLIQISGAMHMYSGDWDERMPPIDNWCEAVVEYVGYPGTFICPAVEGAAELAGSRTPPTPEVYPSGLPKTSSYWMNEACRRRPLLDDWDGVATMRVFLFDAPLGKNRTGTAKDLQFRHNDYTIVTFGDMHSRPYKREEAALLDWSIPPKAK